MLKAKVNVLHKGMVPAHLYVLHVGTFFYCFGRSFIFTWFKSSS